MRSSDRFQSEGSVGMSLHRTGDIPLASTAANQRIAQESTGLNNTRQRPYLVNPYDSCRPKALDIRISPFGTLSSANSQESRVMMRKSSFAIIAADFSVMLLSGTGA